MKRLSRFAKVEIKEIAEGVSPDAETGDILRAVRGYTIALAIEGKKYSSEELAEKLQGLCDTGKEISFIIGSSCGLSNDVKKAADCLMSFSAMTFPHTLMRVIATEQLYRAFSINAGSEYHK